MKKQVVVLVLAAVLVFGCALGGTLAWLKDNTQTVVNTFTAGDVDIELEETTGDRYKMVPGKILDKDPTVTVTDDSEHAWVFVKIVNVNDAENFLSYEIATGWAVLPGHDNVWYREYAGTEDGATYQVLKDNQVTVDTDVTKAQLDGIVEGSEPKLEITAYAVQYDATSIADAEAAWDVIDG
ncbi:MAG: hypothetical protein IJD22_06330 [Clostridia bacterium]|nr:hypothetical protein [Clostridia bacterium]